MDEKRKQALEQRKSSNKKIFKYFLLPVFAIIILIAILSPKETAESKYTNSIAGLMPVDVYLNLENQGFETEKKFDTEYGNLWTCKKNQAGIDYNVTTFSREIDNVERINATVMIDVSQKKIIATSQFLMYMATMPYDKSKPTEAASWVDRNFDKNKVDTIIGDARFTILAPSIASRSLIIEKYKK